VTHGTERTHHAGSRRIDRAWEQRAKLLTEHATGNAITPEYLALLSRLYIDAVNIGEGYPLEALTALTGKSVAATKNHLWQATRKGLLQRHQAARAVTSPTRAEPCLSLSSQRTPGSRPLWRQSPA
jgi:hypothetical protein